MEFIKISVLIFITVILISTVPVYDKAISNLIAISACTIIIIYIINYVTPVVTSIKTVFQDNLSFDLNIIFKSMGISIITQFVADVANDSGNKALANQMVFIGKVAIMALAIPLFSQVLEVIGRLII